MITTKQRSKLKSLANTLKPIVTVGKSCQTSAREMCDLVCDKLGCEPVLCIGNRFVVYKRSDKDGIEHIEL